MILSTSRTQIQGFSRPVQFKALEIQSETDKNFCHFEPFLPFYILLKNLENQNFEKMKNPWRPDIILLLTYTINDEDHMMYIYIYIYIYIWLLRYKVDKQNLLSCWAIVCNFDPF